MSNEALHTAQRILETAQKIMAFTGAGLSTESGISDYRSLGGLWQKYQPVTFEEFLTDPHKRFEYWQRKKEMFAQIRLARPNGGHIALAGLEKNGRYLGTVTQNIDGLHQKAGSRRVLELHGTNQEAVCLNCGLKDDFETVYQKLLAGADDPHCPSCNGQLKPNTISFGQPLNPDILSLAFDWARQCDVVLAVGSSLVVEPAASIPRTAVEYGAKLILINRDATPLDSIAALSVKTDAAAFLNQLSGC